TTRRAGRQQPSASAARARASRHCRRRPLPMPHRALPWTMSPSWYPRNAVRDSAPTWNFAVVHCHGHPVPLDDHGTARHLLQLVDVLEKDRDDRWRMRELGPGGMERRIPGIIGFDLPIGRLEAKFKMGQDERLYDTGGAIRVLEQNDPALATMMKAHNAHRQD
ncbi:hypothetical protein EN914_11680, partial [Mesorhizobium sp. M7A.F.Ca.CA.001.08.2.1]